MKNIRQMAVDQRYGSRYSCRNKPNNQSFASVRKVMALAKLPLQTKVGFFQQTSGGDISRRDGGGEPT